MNKANQISKAARNSAEGALFYRGQPLLKCSWQWPEEPTPVLPTPRALTSARLFIYLFPESGYRVIAARA